MSDEKDTSQGTDIQGVSGAEAPLAVQDVIPEEENDIFSEYLSVSISSDGRDTILSASTVLGEPISYTTTFHGISADDFQSLLSQCDLDEYPG